MIKIIGGNGYIGTNLKSKLLSNSISFESFSNIKTDEDAFFDITKKDYSILNLKENDIVILLAAISSPDVCLNNFEFAKSINVDGTSKLIEFCISNKVNVIFLSSDAVNGNTGNDVYDEFSTVHPFGKYAEMKFEIEHQFMNSPYFKTLRLSYVFSNHDKFSKYLDDCYRNGKVAEVFDGLYRNVILLDTVIETIICLAVNFNFNYYYLCNVSGNQLLSRSDLAYIYSKNHPGFLYKIVPVSKEILLCRPNVIATKSLFLEKLLTHKIQNLK